MNLRKTLLKKYMNLFSRIGQGDPQWEGYTIARNAVTNENRQNALLQISKIRYEESKTYPLDRYFRTDLKRILEGKDVLEIGSNHGGAALAYFELYELKSIFGLDVTESQAEISRLFFKSRGLNSNFGFVKGYAEALPFSSGSFDAVISFDTFEHVSDLLSTMNECFRVLRPNGKLLCVFPSYYHPTQTHLSAVTSAPCLHWVFTPQEIMEAFWDILDDNATYRDRKALKRRPLRAWEKLWIVNGMTLRKFRKLIAKQRWSGVQHIPVPIGSVGKKVEEKPVYKVVKYFSWIGTKLPILEEVANQRIVYILTK